MALKLLTETPVKRWVLLGRFVDQIFFELQSLFFQRCSTLTDHLFQMIDKIRIAHFVIRLTINIYQVTGRRSCQTYICLSRLPGAIYDATNYGNIHRRANIFQPLLKRIHCGNHIKILPRATWAGDKIDTIGAQLKALQYLKAYLDLLYRVGCQ